MQDHRADSSAEGVPGADGYSGADRRFAHGQVLLLATHTRLYLEGLAQALETRAEGFVVLTASTSSEATTRLLSQRVDVLLVDMAMPHSASLMRAAAGVSAGTAVLALAVEESDQDVVACARAGATGYVPRESSLDDLVAAIRHASRGELLCSPRIAARLFRQVGALGDATTERRSSTVLTARELEVVQLIQLGMGNKQIAGRLCIEVATVKNHVHNILEKLRLRGRNEVAARAKSLLSQWDPVWRAEMQR